MNYTVEYFVNRLHLQPHPEGGYFAETYRSTEQIKQEHLPERFTGNRNYSTAIYFLLEADNFSAFHRIQSDEAWHFYYGEPLNVYVIHPEGKLEVMRIGSDLENGSTFQGVVKAGCWFASKPVSAAGFSLAGCTVAPGFDFADFELAEAEILSVEYPQHAGLIRALCR